jgi:hypothetical protein
MEAERRPVAARRLGLNPARGFIRGASREPVTVGGALSWFRCSNRVPRRRENLKNGNFVIF